MAVQRNLSDIPAVAIYKINQSLDLFCWPYLAACRILVPQPGMEPLPLHWECRFLTTGPPGKSLLISRFLHSCVCVSHSVISNSMRSPWTSVHGILQARILGGGGCHFLPQGIFPTQGSNPGILHCRQIFHWLSHQGSPFALITKFNF